MSFNKDQAHAERKRLEGDLRQTVFSKDKMWQMDCRSEGDERRRVQDYDKWKATKGKDGMTNAQKMERLTNINLKFKEAGLEGRSHDMDQVRSRKKIIYD